MLRRILISLALLVALLPYLGFPHSWQAAISTIAGFIIAIVLLFARPHRIPQSTSSSTEHSTAEGKALHVERMEVVERPELYVERETVIDTELVNRSNETETVIEKKTVTTRRRRKSDVEVSATTPQSE